jgi:hypothetical protein
MKGQKMPTKWPQQLKDYWKRVMHSKHKKMSWGAQQVDKIISWARRDNWRRKKK